MLVHILQNLSDEIPQLKVPCNVGTISKKMKLNFLFEQHVCCPCYYSIYNVEVAPSDCIYKPTGTDTPCGTEIFRQQKINPLGNISFTSYNSTPQNDSCRSGQIRLQGQPHLCIPQASFFSQSVLSWLEWFLNVPGIEQGIADCACELSSHKSTIVSDVAQGTVWRSLFPCQSLSNQSLELGFRLFVDWFNPRGNKSLVTNICLSVLHNWYEGVLQKHFCSQWGSDLEIIQNERKQLDLSNSGSDTLMEDNLQSENEDSFDIKCYLPQEVINRLKKRLNEVVVPEGICCIPVGMGTASNGKLKANDWSVLFSIYLPLTILDIFWDLGPKNHLLIINISMLIQCTQIVGA
ncbi:hypothetical protein O181_020964 [Austropuccinia psidii MF-1]|uniref:Uncharacterized protein n=1 Tax=Austropuccinia psidii MF-1 TaxID=1389203 RepID=A0A9Q3CCA0_9BASI|nr:hypothetical protein [Austropuccinia psidii MF-1]